MLVAMRSRHDSPTLEQWSEQIECAKLLDAHIVTDLRSMGIPDEPELNGCDFAANVVKCAEDKGITLCLDTGSASGTRILKEVSKRFESVRYCLDTSHASSNGSVFGGFKSYVDELGSKVAHLHLSDNFAGYSTVRRAPSKDASRCSREIPDTRFPSIESESFGFPGGTSAYQGLCRFWCGGGMPREDWDYLLESLSQCNNDIVGSIEMSPCMPSVMIRQASEFLFDILKWPNRPEVESDHADVEYHPM
jgi:sugar phosphate isomerase/epimerase